MTDYSPGIPTADDIRATGRKLAAMVGGGRQLDVPAGLADEDVAALLDGVEDVLGYRPPVHRR